MLRIALAVIGTLLLPVTSLVRDLSQWPRRPNPLRLCYRSVTHFSDGRAPRRLAWHTMADWERHVNRGAGWIASSTLIDTRTGNVVKEATYYQA